MAKWYGNVGYIETVETEPGIWEEQITLRPYYGDVNRNIYKLQSSDKINSNVNLTNEFSIVADPFAYDNFHIIRFIEYMGKKWSIESVEVQYPRLLLTVGGVYNGEQA